MAARVMRGEPAGRPAAIAAGVQRKCAGCREEEEVNRKAGPGDPAPASHAGAQVDAALAGPGRPLDPATRSFMEPRFGRSFADVRIHDGPAAATAAAAIAAEAFQSSNAIAFAAGRYAPHTESGLHLLAHELAHVTQGGSGIRRKACAHDGRPTLCGGHYWKFVNVATQEVTGIGVDTLVTTRGLAKDFPGNWLTQVWTPPNPHKTGKKRGSADAVRVSTAGSVLSLEIVEVKSRADNPDSGCRRATVETNGYVQALTPIAGHVATISQALRPNGLSIPGNRAPNMREALALRNAGIHLTDRTVALAWNFYNNLQNKLGTVFTAGFLSMEAKPFAGGMAGVTYLAGPPVLEQCTVRGKKGIRTLQLGYQLNGAGGLSYGCNRGPCKTQEEQEEEERKRIEQQQPKQLPIAATPLDQPQGQNVPQQVPEEDEVPTHILVGTGVAATALTAAAILAARKKAEKIAQERLAKEALKRAQIRAAEEAAKRAAARNVINLAERRAASMAAKAGTVALKGGSVALKAAGKAVVYAEVAAALILLISTDAEAKVGFGPSPLETLYDTMTRNGTPPSDEMKALIESDPELKRLAEQAGASGDVTPLQEAATRKMMELVRDNPGEFTAEDLEILRQAQGADVGASIETKEELRKAIDAAYAAQGKATPTTDSTTAGGGGSGSGSGGDSIDAQLEGVSKKFPNLSPAMKGALAAAPMPVKALFDAITGVGVGPVVDDGVVGEFLSIVPADLTDAEKDRLVAAAKPADGADAATILTSLRKAVETIRAATDPNAGTAIQGNQEPGTTAAQPVAQGDAVEADPGEQEAMKRELIRAIGLFDGWGRLEENSRTYVGHFSGAAYGSNVDATCFAWDRAEDGSLVRIAATFRARVTKPATKPGQEWSGVVLVSSAFVGENGASFPGLKVGKTLKGVMLSK